MPSRGPVTARPHPDPQSAIRRTVNATHAEWLATSAGGLVRGIALACEETDNGRGVPPRQLMEALMLAHKFKVGQVVEYVPGRLSLPASGGPYKVIRLLPVENGHVHYRIKSTSETFERVARESELSSRS
jgi:hypothetical protein